mmetsp:Transcript_20904/g.42246  ORF Transcript_20904/g.42246 Transcript_20904/m.42246 type:complete len:212 (-) Transcript_20904:149-784(-)
MLGLNVSDPGPEWRPLDPHRQRNVVYRALTVKEMIDQVGGDKGPWYYDSHLFSLFAKDELAQTSLTEAVESGSRRSHEYISATKEPIAALYYAHGGLALNSAHVIVDIDLDEYTHTCQGVVHDVSSGRSLETEKANNFARAASEVLLKGPVAAGCIAASYDTRLIADDHGVEVPRIQKLGEFVRVTRRGDFADLLKAIRVPQHDGIVFFDI